MEVVYSVSGMTCDACERKVAASLEKIPAVTSARVQRERSRVYIEVDGQVSSEQLQEAASVDGEYTVKALGEDNNEQAYRQPSESEETERESENKEGSESLYPLALIVGYLLGVCLLVSVNYSEWNIFLGMRHFMAGFFLVFSFFKLLDLQGFIDAFRGYDLLARRFSFYAPAYPFIELALGVLYLTNVYPIAVNTVTIVIMGIGSIGVLQALLDKQSIRCACLGTALNLPMTKVTLIEDVTMTLMAGIMLYYSL